jgi:hypothetical protein
VTLARAWPFWAGLILLLCALLAWDPPALLTDLQPAPDSAEYTIGALNWLRSGRYGMILAGQWYLPKPPPGYAALLVPFFALVGPQPTLASTLNWGLTLLLLLCYLLATRRLLGDPGSLAAGAFLALSPTLQWLATRIGTEILSLGVMWAVPALLLLAPPAWLSLVSLLAGLLLGVSSLLRFLNLLWAPALLLLLVAIVSGQPDDTRPLIRRLLPAWSLFTLGVLLGLLPLLAYQQTLYGHPLATGYAYWEPETYAVAGRTFNLQHLWRAPYSFDGNLEYYTTRLLGLGQGVERLYPPSLPLLALLGLLLLLAGRLRQGRLLALFSLSGLGAFLALVWLYYWQEARLLAPLIPLLTFLAGAAVAWAWPRPWRTPAVASVLALAALTLAFQGFLSARNSYLLGGRGQAEPPWRVETLRWLDTLAPDDALLLSDLDLPLAEEYWRQGTNRAIVALERQREWIRRAPMHHLPVGVAAIPPAAQTIFFLSSAGLRPEAYGIYGTRYHIQHTYRLTIGSRSIYAYRIAPSAP